MENNKENFLKEFSKEDLFYLLEELDNLDLEKDKKEILNNIFNFEIEEIKKKLKYIRVVYCEFKRSKFIDLVLDYKEPSESCVEYLDLEDYEISKIKDRLEEELKEINNIIKGR